ncbi:MAG TPA: diguanylate cyclase, partial [Spirochaetota bacterium]
LIKISLVDKVDFVEVRVSDNGIGIPKDKLETIFGRFEQIETGKDSRHKGTGIGLAFARELAGYLRGTIRAESGGAGMGSSFILELRKGKDHFAGLDIQEEMRGETNMIRSKRNQFASVIQSNIDDTKRRDEITVMLPDTNQENEFVPQKGIILVVDDDPQVRDIVVEYLSLSGFRNFITAGNGKDGLDAIYSYKPDMVICDYNMPMMSGDEMHNIMSGNPYLKRVPVIFLTAMSDRILMLERKKNGALAVLGKPIDEKELMVTVETHMNKQMEYAELLSRSSTDELTGLENRRNIIRFLYDRIMLRSYHNLALIIIDCDDMRSINEKHGYHSGDLLLSGIGKVICGLIRSYDRAGRIGGDSFLIVLPETTLGDARIIAEKIRIAIGEIHVPLDNDSISIHASFGISSLQDSVEYIEKTLAIDNMLSLFEVGDSKTADWVQIEKMKREIANLLVAMANDALSIAKQSECEQCHFASAIDDDFAHGRCPRCGAGDILPGNNRVVSFRSE